MFKEFFVFTESGLCLYSWKSPSILESTDSSLIGGLLFAVSEFAKQAFRGRLQRLDLDNSKLIMTAQEFKISLTEGNTGSDNTYIDKTLIFGALVDSKDNNRLIQNILGIIGSEIIGHYDSSGIKPMEKSLIDPLLDELLRKRTFQRKMIYTVFGTLISAIGLLIGSFCISLEWWFFVPPPFTGFFEIVPVLVSGFGIVFFGAMLIGEVNQAVKYILVTNTILSLLLYYIFDTYIKELQYFSSLGTFTAYIIFAILISFTSALLGGLVTERLFLFSE